MSMSVYLFAGTNNKKHALLSCCLFAEILWLTAIFWLECPNEKCFAVVGFWEGGGGFVEEEEFGTLYNLSNGYFSICGLV